MNTWKVKLKVDSTQDEEIELYDAKAYFEGYLKIKRGYFNRLAKAIKISKNYITKKGIEQVIGPDKEDWSLNPWILLFIKENEKNMPFWLLIKREKDLSGLLVAIGPKLFSEFVNQNFADAKRDLKKLINFIVSYLNKFECAVILPNFLS
jgi:hypothetical protein